MGRVTFPHSIHSEIYRKFILSPGYLSIAWEKNKTCMLFKGLKREITHFSYSRMRHTFSPSTLCVCNTVNVYIHFFLNRASEQLTYIWELSQITELCILLQWESLCISKQICSQEGSILLPTLKYIKKKNHFSPFGFFLQCFFP